MTLSILWDKYVAAGSGGYRFSRFRELYRAWEGPVGQDAPVDAAADKLVGDYASDGVPMVNDRLTGELRTAQILVAYAQATWTQGLAD